MNRIVIYTTKTGFTKKYAEWIAEALQCEAVEQKKIDVASLTEYDQVIYGGWIMGNMVSGYDKMKDVNAQNLIVFCSGMSVPSDEVKKTIANQNNIPEEKLFYFEGGFSPKKVGFMGKMIVKMISGSIQKKENKTPEDLHMLETVKGADNTNKDAIISLVEYAKR